MFTYDEIRNVALPCLCTSNYFFLGEHFPQTLVRTCTSGAHFFAPPPPPPPSQKFLAPVLICLKILLLLIYTKLHLKSCDYSVTYTFVLFYLIDYIYCFHVCMHSVVDTLFHCFSILFSLIFRENMNLIQKLRHCCLVKILMKKMKRKMNDRGKDSHRMPVFLHIRTLLI